MDALKSEIRRALIDQKANACPIAMRLGAATRLFAAENRTHARTHSPRCFLLRMRLTRRRAAWHSSGTFDRNTCTGGSNGATMRFAPESTDPANEGLSIVRDLVHNVKVRCRVSAVHAPMLC